MTPCLPVGDELYLVDVQSKNPGRKWQTPGPVCNTVLTEDTSSH